jgi:hypothetical protein
MARFSLAVAIVVVGLGMSGLAQQDNTFKVKPSRPEKQPKSTSAPVTKTAGPATSSAANSKDLQSLEHQTAKASGPSRPAGNAGKKTAPALKPAKDKANPPINFSGAGSGKSAGSNKQSSNPYKGRLKQKHTRQQ